MYRNKQDEFGMTSTGQTDVREWAEAECFISTQTCAGCRRAEGALLFGAGVISVFHLSCECPVMDRSPAPNRLLYCRCLAVYNWKSKGKLLFNLSCRIPTLSIGSRSSWKYKWSNQSARHWLFCIYFSFGTRNRGVPSQLLYIISDHTPLLKKRMRLGFALQIMFKSLKL